jgi:hypothetical protein
MSKSRMGQFRDRVRIDQNTSSDHDPEEDFSGTPFCQSWPCRIVSMAGAEEFQGRLMDAEVTHVVEGWYLSGVLPTMRAVVTAGIPLGATLHVKYVKQIDQADGKPRLMQLHCTEIVSV